MEGLFKVLNTLLIYRNIVHLLILFIAFCIAIAYYINDGNSVSYLVILKYAPKTDRVGTNLLGTTELLIALKDL